MLGSQWVDSQLKMSAVTAEPPIAQVRPMMTQIGMVYSRMMKRPYITALKRPLRTFSERLRKNDTVMGTMGKTQGVRSIRKPQRMASRIRAQRLPPADAALPSTWRVASYSSGGRQLPSLHACHSMCTFTSHGPSWRALTFWTIVTGPSQVPISIPKTSSISRSTFEVIFAGPSA